MTALQNQQISAEAEADVAAGFRDAMGQLATGVVMVTCYVDGRPWGLTVSACCSVSVSPPLLLVSLSKQTASAQAIADDGRFGVSILGEALIDVARFGSRWLRRCELRTSRESLATPRARLRETLGPALPTFAVWVGREGEHTCSTGPRGGRVPWAGWPMAYGSHMRAGPKE